MSGDILNDFFYIEKYFPKILKIIESHRDAIIADNYEIEILSDEKKASQSLLEKRLS